MGSSFGTLFKISTWGESHGGGVGVVIDGCPAGLPITREEIQIDLDRRRPGQNHLTTPRNEADQVEILSGVFENKTLGTPIALLVRNKDANPKAYHHLKNVYRPSHADFTYDQKYGFRNWQGGGRSSARETIGRVAAAVLAKKLLSHLAGIEIIAFVSQLYTHKLCFQSSHLNRQKIESSPVRCPDPALSDMMETSVLQAKKEGDSLGGIISCHCLNVPAGLGVPVFDKIKADLAKAMLSIPATMGFQIGSGFSAADMKASQHNDAFIKDDNQKIRTKSNHSGGTQGGITNGEPLYFDTIFKATATISKNQQTLSKDGQAIELEAKGRHDPCVLPRAVPIVEAMAALVIADHYLRQKVARLDLL